VRPAALGPAAALVALAVGAAGVAVLRHDHQPSAPSAADRRVVPGRVVHVETGVRSTTFLPLGPTSPGGATLSAQRAYNLLVSDSAKLQLIPATVQPYYGVLSDRVAGVGAAGVRVWAFAAESGCSDGARCRTWEFVDARTGHDLGVVTREVLPD
jgi:hypothetical protein